MSRLLWMSCLIILEGGCVSAPSPVPAGEPAFHLGQQGGEPLQVQGDHITGPRSSLIVTDTGMRGVFLNSPVDVTWNHQTLGGTVGSSPTHLEFTEGDDNHVTGSFGGLVVDYILDEQGVRGRVGDCHYTLVHLAPGYMGRRSCGGPLEVELKVNFPEPLLQRPPGEVTAMLTLALANTTPTYSSIASPFRRRAPLSMGLRSR